VPDDRVVVLGLVSTKTSRPRNGGGAAPAHCGRGAGAALERLAISPQCGFASTSEGNRLSADDQRQKLEVVAATARAVWPGGSAARMETSGAR